MIPVVEAAALLGKGVKMRNEYIQMWSDFIGLRVMMATPEQPEQIFMADFTNGYSANLAEVLEFIEEAAPEVPDPIEEATNLNPVE